MKAETCTFEVVSVIMYYKHISEKLTYIRKASHEGGGDKLYTPLYFLYHSDYMQLTQPVIFVPFEFVPTFTDNRTHEIISLPVRVTIIFYHPCASCDIRVR